MNCPIIYTSAYYQAMLGNLIDPALAVPTVLAAAKQGLSNAAFTPSINTVFADTPAPAWTGYAQSATVVWGALLNEANGSASSVAPSVLFRATAVAAPENVYGGFVSDGVASPGTGILGSYRINPTIPIQNPGDGLAVQAVWNMGPDLTRAYASVST